MKANRHTGGALPSVSTEIIYHGSAGYLERYFNYEQYGRDLALSGFGHYGSHWVSVG